MLSRTCSYKHEVDEQKTFVLLARFFVFQGCVVRLDVGIISCDMLINTNKMQFNFLLPLILIVNMKPG